jgi:carbon-monoxide dehydrogenase large subunit
VVQYGIGTFGSRATAVGGTAVLIAIQKLKEKAAKIAAHMMQCEASRLSFDAGCYTRQEATAARPPESPSRLCLSARDRRVL